MSQRERSDRDPRPRLLARARRFAGHDARGELRNDVDLCRLGQAECAQRAFESIDQLTTLAFARTSVPSQCGELIADALNRLRDRRRELAQVAAQPSCKAERV